MEIGQKEHNLPLPPADKVLFRKLMQRELDEIRQEAEEACATDNEIDPISNSAYRDAYLLLEILYGYDIPMADTGWLVDGGIGLEWRPGDGIATMSLYGDGLVVYGASLGNERRVKGTCSLSDPILLPNFLKTLSAAFQE